MVCICGQTEGVTWFGLTDIAVPMTPFTKPAFVSMLRRNMTHAPTANRSLASNPAVMLLASRPFFYRDYMLVHRPNAPSGGWSYGRDLCHVKGIHPWRSLERLHHAIKYSFRAKRGYTRDFSSSSSTGSWRRGRVGAG